MLLGMVVTSASTNATDFRTRTGQKTLFIMGTVLAVLSLALYSVEISEMNRSDAVTWSDASKSFRKPHKVCQTVSGVHFCDNPEQEIPPADAQTGIVTVKCDKLTPRCVCDESITAAVDGVWDSSACDPHAACNPAVDDGGVPTAYRCEAPTVGGSDSWDIYVDCVHFDKAMFQVQYREGNDNDNIQGVMAAGEVRDIRQPNCPCLKEDDLDDLQDLYVEWRELDLEMEDEPGLEGDFYDDFGRAYDKNRKDGGFYLKDNECFLHPFYNGEITLTMGMSRTNQAGNDRGKLRVLENPQSYESFSSKKNAIFAFDIIFLILSLVFIFVFAAALSMYESKSILIVYTYPYTRMQRLHLYTSRILFIWQVIMVLVAFFGWVEGYFLNWRLHFIFIIPYLTVGYGFTCPLKMARANDHYYGFLVEIVARKSHEIITSLQLNQREKLRLLAQYPADLKENAASRRQLEQNITRLEERLPKYRELYGSTGGFFAAFNLCFVGVVWSLALCIYTLTEYFVDSARYTGDYYEAISTGGIRYIPNGDVTLWFTPPADYNEEVVENLQRLYMINLWIHVTGFILLTVAMAARTAASIRNWGDIQDGRFDLEGKSHLQNMMEVFPEKADKIMQMANWAMMTGEGDIDQAFSESPTVVMGTPLDQSNGGLYGGPMPGDPMDDYQGYPGERRGRTRVGYGEDDDDMDDEDDDDMGDGVDGDMDDEDFLQKPIRLRMPRSVYKIHPHAS